MADKKYCDMISAVVNFYPDCDALSVSLENGTTIGFSRDEYGECHIHIDMGDKGTIDAQLGQDGLTHKT